MSINRMPRTGRTGRSGNPRGRAPSQRNLRRRRFATGMDDQRTEPGYVPGDQPGPLGGGTQPTSIFPVYAGVEPVPPPRLDSPAPDAGSAVTSTNPASRPRRARGLGTLLA